MALIHGTLGNSSLNGSTSALAARSAMDIKKFYPSSTDGIYWINLPTVGPTQVYCLMDNKWDGGGWMMMMKATRGVTFSYDATYWTTNNTLNPTDLTRNDGDAKYNVMNYFPAKSLLAIFPDVTTSTGGSLKGLGVHTWLERNFYDGKRIEPTTFFSTVKGKPSTSGGSGVFISDQRLFDGWEAGFFSSQVDLRFYGFNYIPDNFPYASTGKMRWGFGFNENGEGLWPGIPSGASGSNDVFGGIGFGLSGVLYSAGDYIACCQDTTGLNRSMRVEVYCR